MAFRNGILAAVAAAVLAFSQGADAKTFKWAFQGDVATMDPHGLFETMTLGFQSNIYGGLVKKNRDMVTVGNLATSWESVDPTTWRFHLRKGVKFHDAPANLDVADLSGPAKVPDGCVDAFDLGTLLGAWCSFLGGNPCGTCGP